MRGRISNATLLPVPEVVRYFRYGDYVLGETPGEEDAVVLARVLKVRGIKRKKGKVVYLLSARKTLR